MVTKQIKLHDAQETVRLLGEQDARLRELERDFGVEIVVRQDAVGGVHLNVRGSAARTEKAARRLREELDALRRRRAPADPNAFERSISTRRTFPRTAFTARTTAASCAAHAESAEIRRRDRGLRPDHRRRPAGTGRLISRRVRLARGSSRARSRSDLERPVVEAESGRVLPGDLMEKVTPTSVPSTTRSDDAGPERFRTCATTTSSRSCPWPTCGTHVRGRFMILDEARTPRPSRSRCPHPHGHRLEAVVTGDMTQNDLRAHGVRVGARDQGAQGVEGVSVQTLTEATVLRHPLVKRIIRA